MHYTVLTVEPELEQAKKVIGPLIQAGYDAIPVCGSRLLPKLYQLQPDAVVLSDRLPSTEVAFLSQRIRELEAIVLIGFGVNIAAGQVTCQTARSTDALLQALQELLPASELF